MCAGTGYCGPRLRVDRRVADPRTDGTPPCGRRGRRALPPHLQDRPQGAFEGKKPRTDLTTTRRPHVARSRHVPRGRTTASRVSTRSAVQHTRVAAMASTTSLRRPAQVPPLHTQMWPHPTQVSRAPCSFLRRAGRPGRAHGGARVRNRNFARTWRAYRRPGCFDTLTEAVRDAHGSATPQRRPTARACDGLRRDSPMYQSRIQVRSETLATRNLPELHA